MMFMKKHGDGPRDPTKKPRSKYAAKQERRTRWANMSIEERIKMRREHKIRWKQKNPEKFDKFDNALDRDLKDMPTLTP